MSKDNLRFYERYYIINMKLQISILIYAVFFAAYVNGANQVSIYLQANDVAPFLGLSAKVWFWIANVALLYFLVLFGFSFTNRIAGPIFRLKRHLEKMNEGGDAKPFSTRKNDYFHEMLEAYNIHIAEFSELRKKK